ncbi:MAG: helix-turn-helix domain-containing protein [Firmicutes bacterium]|jgi:excisionase family DNA binding protein|nr:helix-turn-helix domain-containing protein [Bacillota bacterium]
MKFYTTDEVAEMWGFNKKFVLRMIKEGNLAAVKMGTEYRITDEQIEDYVKRNTVNTTQTKLAEEEPKHN